MGTCTFAGDAAVATGTPFALALFSSCPLLLFPTLVMSLSHTHCGSSVCIVPTFPGIYILQALSSSSSRNSSPRPLHHIIPDLPQHHPSTTINSLLHPRPSTHAWPLRRSLLRDSVRLQLSQSAHHHPHQPITSTSTTAYC